MNQALKLAISHEGMPVNSWDIYEPDTKADKFMAYIKPYLRIMKDCGYDTSKDCSFSNKVKTLRGDVWREDFSTQYLLILDDGAVMAVRTNPSPDPDKVCNDDNGLEGVCGYIHYDINGIKQPNTIGKDIFVFYIRPNDIIGHSALNDCNWHSDGWACANYILLNGNMKYPK